MSGKAQPSRIAVVPERRPADATAGRVGERAWASAVPDTPRPVGARHSFGDLRVTAGGTPLVVGKPDDAYEIEAERAADRALADGPSQGAPGRLAPARPGLVQRRASANAGAATMRDLPQQLGSAATEARPLPAAQRTFFEQRLGHDFGSVRVHDGPASAAAAASVGAQAFAHGQNVYFGAGEYRPDSRPGQWLIAHELAHTVQQRPNVIARRAMEGVATTDSPLHEGEAPVAPSASPQTDPDDASSQSPRAMAEEIDGLLTGDPSDTSGQARRRVERLPPGARHQVATTLAARQDESPMRRESLARIIGTKPANAPTPEGDLPKAAGDGQRRRPKPGTPQAQADQLAAPAPPVPAVMPDGAKMTRGAAEVPRAKPSAAPPTPALDPGHVERAERETKGGAAVSGSAGRPSAAQRTGSSSVPGGGAPSGAMSVAEDDRPLRLADLFKEGTPKPRTEPAAARGAGRPAAMARAPGAEPDVDEGPVSLENGSAGGLQGTRSDDAQAQMQSLAAQLETALAATRENLQMQSATISGRVRQQAAATRASIRADVTRAVQKIQSGQKSLLADISSTVATTHALIDVSLAMRKVEATGTGLTGQQDIRGIFSGHRDTVERTVNDNVQAADKLSKDKKEDVQKRNRADIRTAYRKGGAKLNSYPGTTRGAYIGGAAFDVAEGVANKMREQEADILNAVGELTAPMPQYFREQGAKALNGFDVNLPKILASVDAGVAKAQGDQNQRAVDAHAKLNVLAAQSTAEIDTLALTAIVQTVAFGPQLETKLDQELGRVLRAIAATPRDVMGRIAPAIEEAIALFRSSEDPDVDAAKQLADGLTGFLDSSTASTASIMQQAADASEERLQTMRGGARQAMSAQVERSDKAWQGSRAGFASTASALHTNADNAFAGAVALLAGTLTSTQESIRTQLAPVVEKLAGSFADARRDAEGKIDARIDEGMGKNTEALGKLDGTMAEAASDAAYEWDHPVLSSLETGLKFLAGLIAGLLVILVGLALFLLVGWLVAGVLGVLGIAVSVAEAGLLVMAFTIGYSFGKDFGARLAAGQGVKEAFLGAAGDFPGMLYEMTGIPKVVKGFSDERLTPFERGMAIGEGLGQLVLTVLMLRSAPRGIARTFRDLPPFRSPTVTAEPVTLPEVAAPRAPVEPTTPGPAAEGGVPRPTEQPMPASQVPATTAGAAQPEPVAAPAAPTPQVAAEPTPSAPSPTTGGPVPAGEPVPALRAAPEPVRPVEPPAPRLPTERTGLGPEGEAVRDTTQPGPPKAEPDTERIGFGPKREAARAAQPRPPGAEPYTERIGPGREAARAAQPRPPGTEPDTPRIGFGREAVRAAQPRPPAPQAPVEPEGGSFIDLRGQVVESGQPAAGTTAAAGEAAGAGGRSPVDVRASAEPPGAGGPRSGGRTTSGAEEPHPARASVGEGPTTASPTEAAKFGAGPRGLRPGSRVTHKTFGEGRVIRVFEGKATVAFEGVGEKTIQVDWLSESAAEAPAGETAAEAGSSGPRRPEETPREQYYRGQKRARGAASKEGIKLRKQIAFRRLSSHQYDPLQDLLTPDELQAFLESGGKKLPKNIDWHHTVQTSQDPGMADVPEHIQPVRYTEHLEEHLGDPGKVPTAGIRGDVTTPERPIYDPNDPEVQAGRYNPSEPAGEGGLEQEGIGETPARKSPNFRNLPRVRDPALRDIYDYEYRTPEGDLFRHHISSNRWVLFPS